MESCYNGCNGSLHIANFEFQTRHLVNILAFAVATTRTQLVITSLLRKARLRTVYVFHWSELLTLFSRRKLREISAFTKFPYVGFFPKAAECADGSCSLLFC